MTVVKKTKKPGLIIDFSNFFDGVDQNSKLLQKQMSFTPCAAHRELAQQFSQQIRRATSRSANLTAMRSQRARVVSSFERQLLPFSMQQARAQLNSSLSMENFMRRILRLATAEEIKQYITFGITQRLVTHYELTVEVGSLLSLQRAKSEEGLVSSQEEKDLEQQQLLQSVVKSMMGELGLSEMQVLRIFQIVCQGESGGLFFNIIPSLMDALAKFISLDQLLMRTDWEDRPVRLQRCAETGCLYFELNKVPVVQKDFFTGEQHHLGQLDMRVSIEFGENDIPALHIDRCRVSLTHQDSINQIGLHAQLPASGLIMLSRRYGDCIFPLPVTVFEQVRPSQFIDIQGMLQRECNSELGKESGLISVFPDAFESRFNQYQANTLFNRFVSFLSLVIQLCNVFPILGSTLRYGLAYLPDCSIFRSSEPGQGEVEGDPEELHDCSHKI
jgi:hypothetical protein